MTSRAYSGDVTHLGEPAFPLVGYPFDNALDPLGLLKLLLQAVDRPLFALLLIRVLARRSSSTCGARPLGQGERDAVLAGTGLDEIRQLDLVVIPAILRSGPVWSERGRISIIA